ncbi:MAG: kynureninase [Anaerolineae bacterium]|nr:kynureninase [Anaerolineales bacterium]MCQ3975401.1 kynureninase [Anaerolineae bacterium]
MNFTRTDLDFAHELDAQDELASFRDEFVIEDPDLIYLDGNSLGRLPKRTIEFMRRAIEVEWGERLIRLWNDGWVRTPTTLGAKIAQLVGAQPDEILVTEATSINLFKLAVAALRARPERAKIVSDVFNFPSDLYILQGIIDLLGRRHRLELIPSADTITIDPAAVGAAIDDDTALVSLTHVAFKSAFMYDLAAVTEQAHRAGALMLWDLSHSVGAVPLDLNGSKADLAIGCTYKYLNGGPGAPAFLYVRRDLQSQLNQPMWGWFAAKNPFAFDLEYTPADDIARYKVGTPPMLSMKAVEPALDILLEAGMARLRAKSIRQTDYLIFLAEQWLEPLGFTIGTPRRAEVRGSHVSLRHAESYRINRALIEAEPPAVRVIPDFRAPDNIRLGLAPLYTTFTDIYRAMARLREIVETRLYEQYSAERLAVT